MSYSHAQNIYLAKQDYACFECAGHGQILVRIWMILNREWKIVFVQPTSGIEKINENRINSYQTHIKSPKVTWYDFVETLRIL